ncbi:MBL fold metallo-hydrolase [Pseudostreptobacillus hongkongensis]|uniref:MBL fold metallo-hydrolase n=1 Tax=Pseudostreptobacillus hongkongensis TaxID=1162717 RepID=UPI00082E83B8|nr:MBL fold metallo-hydrolase [Pseudostreptobacillus hongkongensis]
MQIKTFNNIDTTSNTYLLEINDKYYVIDPGNIEMKNLITYLEENKINISGIVLTHGHYDHIIGIPKILEYKNVNVYISNIEKEFLYNPRYSLLFYSDLNQTELEESLSKTNVVELIPGESFEGFEIIHTPGHTKGGICLYSKDENTLISGDTMFKGTYGRVDLPTGNFRDMNDSLLKLLKLGKETVVYPGHGDTTTIGNEYNMYYSSL